MPWPRPTLTTLRDQGRQDVSTSPIGADGLLRYSLVGTLSDLNAGFAYSHYSYLDYIALQSNPATAEDEFCDAWGGLKGVARKPATATVLRASFPATNGLVVTAGTGVNLANGVAYVVTADAEAVGNAVLLTVSATVPGASGNASVGAKASLASSIVGVSGTAGVVTAQVTPGADLETDDEYKTRYLQAYRSPAQGGNVADYVRWAAAVPGITRVWVAPHGYGPGTVVLYVMLDDSEAAQGGFPQGANGVASAETRDPAYPASGDQLAVANALLPLQPVTALVYVCAPIPMPVTFSITGLGANNTQANQDAIRAALRVMFLQQGQVGGTLNPDTMQSWPAINPSAWYLAVSSVVGDGQFAIPSPAAPISPGPGQLPVLGAVSFAA